MMDDDVELYMFGGQKFLKICCPPYVGWLVARIMGNPVFPVFNLRHRRNFKPATPGLRTIYYL